MSKQFRGIFAIPPTPFKENLEIDQDGLKSCIKYCTDAGSHGIVIPVNASEFSFLSDAERMQVVEIAVKAADGKTPVIAGVSGVCAKVAAGFARHAQACGADGIIAMPPYVNKASSDQVYEYYKALSEAVKIPIFIQNYIAPVGTPLSAEFLIKLVGELENVDYIKEETIFSSHVITEVVTKAQSLPAGKFKGVMGGKAGRYLIDEYRRGASGNMPACEVADIQVQIWEALEAGDEQKAIGIYNRVIPLLNFEAVYGAAVYKEVLKRRGVIGCSAVRALDGRSFDRLDHVELDRIMAEIKPLFTVNY